MCNLCYMFHFKGEREIVRLRRDEDGEERDKVACSINSVPSVMALLERPRAGIVAPAGRDSITFSDSITPDISLKDSKNVRGASNTLIIYTKHH